MKINIIQINIYNIIYNILYNSQPNIQKCRSTIIIISVSSRISLFTPKAEPNVRPYLYEEVGPVVLFS